jgi:hypothetical protein
MQQWQGNVVFIDKAVDVHKLFKFQELSWLIKYPNVKWNSMEPGSKDVENVK